MRVQMRRDVDRLAGRRAWPVPSLLWLGLVLAVLGLFRPCESRAARPVPPVIGEVASALPAPAPAGGACFERVPVPAPMPSEEDRRLIDRAMFDCHASRRGSADPWELWGLLELERSLGVPQRLRGISLAIACCESGYSGDAVGDGGLAVGWAQLHDLNWRTCNQPDRTTALGSLRCYLWLASELAATKTRSCGRSAWEVAEVAVGKGRIQDCDVRNRHQRTLARWRKFAKVAR